MSKLTPIPELEITISCNDLDLPTELKTASASVQSVPVQPLDINAEIYQWILHLVKSKSAHIKVLRSLAEKVSARKLVQDIADAQSFVMPPETAAAFDLLESLQKTARTLVTLNKMLTFVKELANEKDLVPETKKDFNDSAPLPKIFDVAQESSEDSFASVPYFSLKEYMLARYKTIFSAANPELLLNPVPSLGSSSGPVSDLRPERPNSPKDLELSLGPSFLDSDVMTEVSSVHYSDVTFLTINEITFKLRADLWTVFHFLGIPCEDKRTQRVYPPDWTQVQHPKKIFIRFAEDPILCVKWQDQIFATYENFDIERFNFIGAVFLSRLLSIPDLNDPTINYDEMVKKIITSRIVRPVV